MPISIKSRAQAKFAALWLKDTCTVVRSSGWGTGVATASATGIRYKHESEPQPTISFTDGGVQSLVTDILKFAVGANVRADDQIIDSVTGKRYKIIAKSDRSLEFLQTFTATDIQGDT